MKFKSIFVYFACLTTPLFSMEESNPKTNITEKDKNWSWFITYLNFSHKTKTFSYHLASFDSSIRIYDMDKQKLILLLQRLTNEGKSAEFRGKDIEFEGYITPNDIQLLLIKDQKKTILSIERGSTKNTLLSYDEQDNVDLKIIAEGSIKMCGGLIRLSPSNIYVGTDYDKFFSEQMQKNT